MRAKIYKTLEEIRQDWKEIPFGIVKNYPGEKFNRLTIIYRTEARTTRFVCKCDCGNYVSVAKDSIINNHTKSCGCYNLESLQKRNSLKEIPIGTTFGYLTVIEKTNEKNKNGNYLYLCNCICGSQIKTAGNNLKQNKRTSCGCYHRELKDDLSGKIFGFLTVLNRIDNKNGKVWYQCKCSCGNLCEVSASHLKDGHTTSCGCNKKSRGEIKIEKILNNSSIKYSAQKTFNDLLSDKNKHMYFDFYLDDKNIAIEYDGEQHFSPTCFNGTVKNNAEEEFLNVIKRDNLKNQYCIKNNILLYRIPYYDKDKIHILDDILQDKYLINKK